MNQPIFNTISVYKYLNHVSNHLIDDLYNEIMDGADWTWEALITQMLQGVSPEWGMALDSNEFFSNNMHYTKTTNSKFRILLPLSEWFWMNCGTECTGRFTTEMDYPVAKRGGHLRLMSWSEFFDEHFVPHTNYNQESSAVFPALVFCMEINERLPCFLSSNVQLPSAFDMAKQDGAFVKFADRQDDFLWVLRNETISQRIRSSFRPHLERIFFVMYREHVFNLIHYSIKDWSQAEAVFPGSVDLFSSLIGERIKADRGEIPGKIAKLLNNPNTEMTLDDLHSMWEVWLKDFLQVNYQYPLSQRDHNLYGPLFTDFDSNREVIRLMRPTQGWCLPVWYRAEPNSML